MKHIKPISTLLLALTLLSSCNGSSPEVPTSDTNDITSSENLAEDYIIMTVENMVDPYLGKLNIRTGVLTPLCSDPVCSHDTTDCPMYCINPAYKQKGNMIYYIRTGGFDDEFDRMGLFSYNLENGKTEKLLGFDEKDADGFPVGFDLTDKYIMYYCDKIKEDAVFTVDEFGYSAPRLEDEYYEIWRLDLSTKETVRLGDTQSFKLPYADAGMLKYDSETVTWGIGREIVVTDYDFNIISVEDHNRETFAWQVGEYAYRSKKAADPDAASYGAKDYYLVDSSGEEKLIIENMLRMIMVDDKIVYMKYDKDKCRVVFSKEDIPDLKNEYVQYFNNEIYIMNADGSDAHLIGTVDDPYIDNSHAYIFTNISGTVYTKEGICLAQLWHPYTYEVYDPETKEKYTNYQLEDLGGYVMIDTVNETLRVVYMNGEPYTPVRDISAELKK